MFLLWHWSLIPQIDFDIKVSSLGSCPLLCSWLEDEIPLKLGPWSFEACSQDFMGYISTSFEQIISHSHPCHPSYWPIVCSKTTTCNYQIILPPSNIKQYDNLSKPTNIIFFCNNASWKEPLPYFPYTYKQQPYPLNKALGKSTLAQLMPKPYSWKKPFYHTQ